MPERVAIIVPHFIGDVVVECVRSIHRSTGRGAWEIVVVDDQPYDDGSLGKLRARHPDVRVVSTGGSRGFGAACNAGIQASESCYVVLLNNDVIVQPGWLEALLSEAEEHPNTAVFQAKVRSLETPERFEYSGAAGGLIDRFGYLFALGRMFDTVEIDRGQYDEPREIFWAVGAAMMIRRRCLDEAGGLDPEFYMHMEEVDLCWRMHLLGYGVRSVPSSVVLHHGGWTLDTSCFRKVYLNHRNNLVLLIKNLSAASLAWVLPCRLILEAGTLVFGIVRRDWKHPVASLLAAAWMLSHPLSLLRRRRQTQRMRRVPDREVARRVFQGSVVVAYFLRGVRTAAALRGRRAGGDRRCTPGLSAPPGSRDPVCFGDETARPTLAAAVAETAREPTGDGGEPLRSL